jgi:integrase
VPARTAAQRRRLDQLCEWLNITERHARKLVERNAIPYRKVGHLRWGELAELRAGDLDLATGILTVSRTVVELDPKFHPDGRRFLVKPYPKTTKYRRLKLSRQVVARTSVHVGERHLGADDLLFTVPADPPPRLVVLPDPETLGRTEPNGAGRRYRHGTLTGYSLGKCHCEYCKAAYAHYR